VKAFVLAWCYLTVLEFAAQREVNLVFRRFSNQ
jgi:hypothetical protein